MDNEKNLKLESGLRGKDENLGEGARARNRTVMLTPEVTGQVRARLAQEGEGALHGIPALEHGGRDSGGRDSGGRDSGGFESPRASSAFGSPTGSAGYPNMSSESDFTPVGRGGTGTSASGSYRQPGAGLASSGAHSTHAAQPARAGIVWSKETPVVGFLVSYDKNPNGEVFELRTGRIMVTSQGNEPNSIVLNDDSVSSMHAVMRISPEGEIQVLDQLSEFGTRIKRAGSSDEEQLSGEKGSVKHGDMIKFGDRAFHVCLVADRS